MDTAVSILSSFGHFYYLYPMNLGDHDTSVNKRLTRQEGAEQKHERQKQQNPWDITIPPADRQDLV